MDFLPLLLEKLKQRHKKSANLLYLEVQNWIVFQRSTFDYFDENGDPYTSQIFLIEINSGRYIHRAQGVKVDHGTTQDTDLLVTKLMDALVDTKVCQGYPLQDIMVDPSYFLTLDYPFPRWASQDCSQFFQSCKLELEDDLGTNPEKRQICPQCQKAKQNTLNEDVEGDSKVSVGVDLNHVFLDASLKYENQSMEILSEFDEAPEEPYDSDLNFSFESENAYDDGEDEDEQELRYPKRALKRKIKAECKYCQNEFSETCQYCQKKRTRRSNKGGLSTSKKKTKESSSPRSEETKSSAPRRQIKCHHCSKVFNSIHVYHTHQRKKRKIACQECDKEMITFDDLKKHLVTHHPQSLEGPFKALWENDENVETMKFPKGCYLCDRVYNGHVMLNRHKELYHELGDFRCEECQTPCLTFYDFIIHNYQKHAKVISHLQPYTGGLEVVLHKNGKTEMKRENYSCQFCSSAFKFDTAHTSHMRRNHGFGLFECHSCDEMGHYAGAISAHMLNFHADNPEVKCPGCLKVVNLKDQPNGFLEHYGACKRAWTASKNSGTYEKGVFQCHYCGKEYASKVVFRAHIKQHEGIERFKCTYCDYGTNIKKVLEDHEKGHLRERGLTSEEAGMKLYYDCDQCDKKFVQESGLRSHKRRIHLGIKKSYLCKDCGEVYPNIQGYYKHKREKHGYVAKNIGRKGRRSHGPI